MQGGWKAETETETETETAMAMQGGWKTMVWSTARLRSGG